MRALNILLIKLADKNLFTGYVPCSFVDGFVLLLLLFRRRSRLRSSFFILSICFFLSVNWQQEVKWRKKNVSMFHSSIVRESE